MGGKARAQIRSLPVSRPSPEHLASALEAARAAKSVLALFESQHPDDARPREAIVAIRAWARGERRLGMAAVRTLALAAHAAAREAESDAATFAARAAGHAIATWHVPSHATAAHSYAAKAVGQTELSSHSSSWARRKSPR
jgi:hypothetical protein